MFSICNRLKDFYTACVYDKYERSFCESGFIDFHKGSIQQPRQPIKNIYLKKWKSNF